MTYHCNDLWRAVRSAVGESYRLDVNIGVHPERFLELLEAEGFTIMPLEIRRAADVFGTVAVVKTTDGYGIMDPVYTKVVISPAAREVP